MLTAAELRERLGWPDVVEEADPEHELVYLIVRPTHPGLRPINFGLDDDRLSIDHFGFGHWHYHPDDIDEAVETARQLIRGEVCVVEEIDAAGKNLGGGLLTPEGLPDTMSKQAATLRRVFFDREPVVEPIHFGLYFEGQHIWLSLEKKAEIDRILREAGMPEEKGW
jgi:hypothetical protein